MVRYIRWFFIAICFILIAWCLPHLGFRQMAWPIYLIGLLLVPVLIAVQIYSHKKQLSLQNLYMNHMLREKVYGQELQMTIYLRYACISLIFICLLIAISRPQGEPTSQNTSGSGIDILIAIDISSSMKVEDIPPNRISVARAILKEFLRHLSFDRVGLIVFSGESMPLSPLTNDYSALDSLINEISIDLISVGGTNLIEMLELSAKRFKNSEETGKMLIVFSDGEQHKGELNKAVGKLKEMGVVIYTVGMGTEEGGPIPERRTFFGDTIYKTYQGKEVISKLNSDALQKLAEITDGAYIHSTDPLTLVRQVLRARKYMKQKTFKSSDIVVYEEKYQWYLLLALALFIMERLIYLSSARVNFQGTKLLKQVRHRFKIPLVFPGGNKKV